MAFGQVLGYCVHQNGISHFKQTNNLEKNQQKKQNSKKKIV